MICILSLSPPSSLDKIISMYHLDSPLRLNIPCPSLPASPLLKSKDERISYQTTGDRINKMGIWEKGKSSNSILQIVSPIVFHSNPSLLKIMNFSIILSTISYLQALLCKTLPIF